MANNLSYFPCPAPPNYTEGQCVGMMLPLLDDSGVHVYVRAFFYLLGMLYTFVGISLAADIFMVAIERITSEKRIVRQYNPVTGKEEEKEVDVWNPTVANLSLMALGSSAPEILLSIIEITGNGFHAGKLGPSTIVGSAAFNLLMITAICIGSIPKREVRRVEQVLVFAITGVFSMFAYFWLMFILVIWSPNRIEVWEGVVTLVFFIGLIVFAYMADKKICCGRPDPISEFHMEVAKQKELRYGEIEKDLAIKNPDLTSDQIARLTAAAIDKQHVHSKVYYRLATTKWLSKAIDEEKERSVVPGTRDSLSSAGGPNSLNIQEGGGIAVIEFSAEKYAANENDGFITVELVRTGNKNSEVDVFVETIDGSALKHEDYRPFEEIITFKRGQTEALINIKIVDDDQEEDDEIFYVRVDLANPVDRHVKIGTNSITEITITEKRGPCQVSFEKSSYIVEETCGIALMPLIRTGVYNKPVKVEYRTEDITATDGEDYIGGTGAVVFEPGEVRKHIKVPIVDDVEVGEKHESFKVLLFRPKGAELGQFRNALVTIIGDERVFKWFNEVDGKVAAELEDLQTLETKSWKEQFDRSLNVNNGDTKNATLMDYVTHVVAFGWKFLLAFVPPAHYGKGWVTFVIAIAVIGAMTALVADFASIFGCLIKLDDTVTAITLVALGTSVPDLFASKIAAVNEKTADSSIGNVNGSNSVNVFLGLGLPWTIAAVYWHLNKKSFCVNSGDLKISVSIYLSCSILCYVLLALRRKLKFMGSAELGGPKAPKYMSAIFLVFLWITYIVVSSLNTMKIINLG